MHSRETELSSQHERADKTWIFDVKSLCKTRTKVCQWAVNCSPSVAHYGAEAPMKSLSPSLGPVSELCQLRLSYPHLSE